MTSARISHLGLDAVQYLDILVMMKTISVTIERQSLILLVSRSSAILARPRMKSLQGSLEIPDFSLSIFVPS
jgi:hypothetical protein